MNATANAVSPSRAQMMGALPWSIDHHHINKTIAIAATPSKNAATPYKMPIIRSSFMDHVSTIRSKERRGDCLPARVEQQQGAQ
jgi:hypothetical protein